MDRQTHIHRHTYRQTGVTNMHFAWLCLMRNVKKIRLAYRRPDLSPSPSPVARTVTLEEDDDSPQRHLVGVRTRTHGSMEIRSRRMLIDTPATTACYGCCARLPTGIPHCQHTRTCHQAKALGGKSYPLTVWHFCIFRSIWQSEICNLTLTYKAGNFPSFFVFHTDSALADRCVRLQIILRPTYLYLLKSWNIRLRYHTRLMIRVFGRHLWAFLLFHVFPVRMASTVTSGSSFDRILWLLGF